MRGTIREMKKRIVEIEKQSKHDCCDTRREDCVAYMSGFLAHQSTFQYASAARSSK
jgi:hypothetical protein